jgi:Tol biopolymer transport system component
LKDLDEKSPGNSNRDAMKGGRGHTRGIGVLIGAAVLTLAVPSAFATFPGKNGRIFFVRERAGGTQIWRARPNGTQPLHLTGFRGLSSNPSVSPDGKWVAFDRRLPHRPSIVMRVNRNSSDLTRLASSRLDQSDPSVAGPDGNRIAYTNGHHIELMPSDGSWHKKLTSGAQNDSEPAFSPDGRHIAFVRALRGNPHNDQIYTMHDDGTHIQRVRPQIEGLSHARVVTQPCYSPNGRWIAFRTRGSASSVIGVMRTNGTDGRLLTSGVHHADSHPAYSPNGNQIVFERWTEHGVELETMKLNGSHEQRIIKGASPDWSVLP